MTNAAFESWWSAQTKRGDPSRNPRLTKDAFEAGMLAASIARTPPEKVPQLRDDLLELERLALETAAEALPHGVTEPVRVVAKLGPAGQALMDLDERLRSCIRLGLTAAEAYDSSYQESVADALSVLDHNDTLAPWRFKLAAISAECTDHEAADAIDALLEAAPSAVAAEDARQLVRDALEEALSVCRSGHIGFWQTEEWCRWLEVEVAPKLQAALTTPHPAPAVADKPAAYKSLKDGELITVSEAEFLYPDAHDRCMAGIIPLVPAGPITTEAPAVAAEAGQGRAVLARVVAGLRAEARFVDEEGEDTNALEDLLAALATQPAPPSQKQLAEALKLAEAAMNYMGDALNNMDACTAEDEEATAPAFEAVREALTAYRSAQQAEAGAAGGVREQFAKASEAAGYGRPEMGPWSSDQRQGVEQARAVVYRVESTMNLEAAPAEDFNAGCYVVPVDSVRMAMERPLSEADPRCAGCDIPNGCPEYCRCQPAASSAQEPWGYGWEFDSVGCAVVGRKAFTDSPLPTQHLRNVFARGPFPLYLAAPARLACAAQGEAIEAKLKAAGLPTSEASAECDAAQSIFWRNLNGAPISAQGAYRSGWFGHAAVTAPQAQVERKPTLSQSDVFFLIGIAHAYQTDGQHDNPWALMDLAARIGEAIGSPDIARRCIELRDEIPTASTASDEGSV